MTRAGPAAVLLLLTLAPPARADLTVTRDDGSAAAIQSTVDAFRASLGALNPNNNAPATGGRREINWDGVPDAFADPNALPLTFFLDTSPRGLQLSQSGTPTPVVKVSANATNPTSTPVTFMNAQFAQFSPQRLFGSPTQNTIDLRFRVPVPAQPAAAVRAFGAVFTDVDVADATTIEAFDADGASLGKAAADTENGDFSFLGLTAPSAQIAAVRITTGTTAIQSADVPGADTVALDDFIYAEPEPLASSGASFEDGLAPFTADGATLDKDAHGGSQAALLPDGAERTLTADLPAGRLTTLTFASRLDTNGVARVEGSTDGGATWATAGEPSTGENGPGYRRTTVELGPATRYRFRLSGGDRRGWWVDDVETTSVAAPTPSPSPTASPSPSPAPTVTPADTTAPRLSRLRRRGRRFTVRVSEAARLTVKVRGRRRYVVVAARAGRVRGRRIPRRRVRIRIVARDAAGNVSRPLVRRLRSVR